MVTYTQGFTGGDLRLPPSKSTAHRALLCAALSGGRSRVSEIDRSRDMEATLGALRALGVHTHYDSAAKSVTLNAAALGDNSGGEIECLESGSTLRFLLPIAAALGGAWRFTGQGRLPQRPLTVYEKLLPEHGVSYRRTGEDQLPVILSGRLQPGRFSLPGNVSSQFVTGLLLALPLLEGDSEIVLTSPLESAGYVEITRSVLADFGVAVEPAEHGWRVPGGQRYQAPEDYAVQGDWSQAAFFLCMAALDPAGGTVRLHGLDPASPQGDRACVALFEGFGLSTRWENGVLVACNPHCSRPFGGLRGQEIDAAQIPDLVPALAVCAALSRGESRIVGAGRLRWKESDRLAAMEQALNALGGQVSSTEDSLVIQGVERLTGGRALGQNDHRVLMALAAAALRSSGPVSVTDEDSIEKSYPGFFHDFEKLGGNAHVVHVGRTD